MVKHIIFDFDGTIVDSGRLVFDLFNEFADKYNYKKIPERDAELIRSLSVKDRFIRLRVPVLKVPLLTMDVVRRYKAAVPNLKANEDIKTLLLELHKSGYRLVLISANSKENIVQFLRQNQIDIFKEIITSNRFFGRHYAINQYLKAHNVKKDEVIFVGDEQRDIVACQKSQIRIISVTWGYDLESLLQQSSPDYIAQKPTDIMKIVKGISL